MNPNITALYKIIRNDDQIMAKLSGLDAEPFADAIMDYSTKHSLPLTRSEALSAISAYDQVVQSAVNDDDELTDFELEMAAAGSPSTNSDT